MITILFPFYNLGLGGVQTKIIDLANTLVKSKKVKVILYLEKKENFDRSAELDSRVQFIYCPQILPNLIKRRYYYYLLLIILIYRPLSIFVSLEKTTIFLLQVKKFLPFIKSRLVVNVDTYLRKEQIYSTKLLSNLYPTADEVLAPSQAALHDFYMRLHVPTPPARYLPNWIEVPEKSLKKYQKTEEFLFAGRLVAQKDPMLYIKFMKELKKKKISAKLAIFGEGVLKNHLATAIKKAGLSNSISIYPPSHQIARELKKTRFLLLLSKYEGMPLIGLEAMRYGCVILGKNVPGIQDLVVDGETGFCQKNVKLLVKKYLTVRSNSKMYHQMQLSAFAYLKKNFDQKRRSEVIKLLTQTEA